MRELLIAFLILIFDTRRFGKPSTQIMRRTCLQRFTVLHHCLNAVGCHGTRETFVFRLLASNNGHGQRAFCKGPIHFKRTHGFLHRVFAVDMGSMPFLPQKLACAQKHTGPHFPTDDVCPLVYH